MAKLTDTQLVVLSQASERDDGAASVPERLNRAATAKVCASLIARKQMREIRSKPGMPVWRVDDDGRRVSLLITRAGREAIDAEDKVGARRPPGEASKPRRGSTPPTDRQSASSLPRPGSKQALVVAMLTKDKGATLGALAEATSWLPHTTRAAITGLRKRGFAIERTRDERHGSLYRIVDGRAAPARA